MKRLTSSSNLRAAALLVAGGATFAACEPTTTEDALPNTAVRIDGNTTHVDNLGGGEWLTAELVEAVSIGAADGAPEDLLGNVRGVGEVDAGIVVLDVQVGVPRLYSHDGVYIRDLASRGDGPGQFRRAFDMSLSPEGGIYVRDLGKSRIFRVDTAGNVVEEWVARGSRLTVLQGGKLFLQMRADDAPAGQLRFGMRGHDHDGPTDDWRPLPIFEAQPQYLTVNGNLLERLVAQGSSVSLREVPFGATQAIAMSSNGDIVGGVSTAYRYEVHRADGTVRVVTREAPPVPVQRDEAEWYRRRLVAAWREVQPEWNWEGDPIPDTKAPYRHILADADGRVWLRRELAGIPAATCNREPESFADYVEGPCWRQPQAADVFDRDGMFLGQVALPEGLRFTPLPYARGDRFVAVVEDEAGTLFVKAYRLVTTTR